MAIITSAQTGNWEDTTTWVGGVVPSNLDEIIIADGHIVRSKVTKTISNTITIGTGSQILIGTYSGNVYAELQLDGVNISGTGSLIVEYGKLSCNPIGNWNFITGLTINGVSTNWKRYHAYDMHNTTFENCEITFKSGTETNDNYAYNFEKLIFIDSVARFHDTSAIPIVEIPIDRCMFIDSQASLTSHLVSHKITRSVFTATQGTFGKVVFSTLDSEYTNTIDDTVFINQGLNFVKDSVFTNCYFAHNTASEGEGFVSGLPSNDTTQLMNCIVYASDDLVNNRAVAHSVVVGSFVESWSSGSSNVFIKSGTVTWTNNILVGIGDGFTSVVSTEVPALYNIDNNTCVYDSYIFSTLERNLPLAGSAISYKNNLFISNSTETKTFIQSINGMSGSFAVDTDYNFANVDNWISSQALIDSNGVHNQVIAQNYPSFVEARNHDTFAQTIGGTTYRDVFEYVESLNGYNSTTKQYSDTPLTETAIADMLGYFKEGYTPTNMALATAGEAGTYVGAIEPKQVSVESADLTLSANKTNITLGETITFTLELSQALSTDTTVVLTVDGTDRNCVISAGSTQDTTTHKPSTQGTKLISIKSTDNENVNIVSPSSVSVVVEEDIPVDPPIDPPVETKGGVFWKCSDGVVRKVTNINYL